jgi:hypothetical protein
MCLLYLSMSEVIVFILTKQNKINFNITLNLKIYRLFLVKRFGSWKVAFPSETNPAGYITWIIMSFFPKQLRNTASTWFVVLVIVILAFSIMKKRVPTIFCASVSSMRFGNRHEIRIIFIYLCSFRPRHDFIGSSWCRHLDWSIKV